MEGSSEQNLHKEVMHQEEFNNLNEGTQYISNELLKAEQEHPENPSIVVISGATGSGKSTLAGLLAGVDTTVLTLDRYYRNETDLKDANGNINWSTPAALDSERISADLQRLLRAHPGESINVPIYEMKESRRVGEEPIIGGRRIIIEGVYANTSTAGVEVPLRVHVDAEDNTLLDRKLDRDVRERGIPENTVRGRFEKNVRPALEEFVRPQKDLATIVINNNVPVAK